jgi:hypothetical protein
MRRRLQRECPYAVRYAHSPLPVPEEGVPFLLLDVGRLTAEDPVVEAAGRIRYPITALLTVTAVVPLSMESTALQQIAAAYILPAMVHAGCSVAGITMEQTTDNRLLHGHTLEMQFRLHGVYTLTEEAIS